MSAAGRKTLYHEVSFLSILFLYIYIRAGENRKARACVGRWGFGRNGATEQELEVGGRTVRGGGSVLDRRRLDSVGGTGCPPLIEREELVLR